MWVTFQQVTKKMRDYRIYNLMVSIFSNIININLTSEDSSWIQATLPVRYGGLGIMSASFLAPSAFLASADGVSSLMQGLLPPHLSSSHYLERDSALKAWRQELPSQTSTPPVHRKCGRSQGCLFYSIPFLHLVIKNQEQD